VGYDCNSFCLIVENNIMVNDLLHLMVIMILGSSLFLEILYSLSFPCKRKRIPQKKKFGKVWKNK